MKEGAPVAVEGAHTPVHCDRCGCEGGSAAFSAPDYLTGLRFAILRCGGCGLLRTDFRGSPEDLASHYGPSYYGCGGIRFNAALERAIRIVRDARAREVANAAGTPGRILDVGCGRGLMLAALRRMGWECVGTEIDPGLAESVRRLHGFEVLEAWGPELPFPDASFDAVTFWHSLEHTARPLRTLEEAARILRPGGLLIVEVPNADSLQARLGGSGWFHLDAPRHLYHFGRRDLGEILLELKFSVRRERTLSFEQGPFGMVQSLLNHLTFAPNVLYRLMRGVGGGGRPRRLDSGAGLRGSWDVAVTLLSAVPLGALCALLEMGACAMGRGGVIRFVAKKRTAAG